MAKIRLVVGIFLAVALSCVAVVAAPGTARADNIAVGGSCSLPDAVQAANTDAAVNGCDAGSGADVITLPAGADITLSDSLFIASDLSIEGNGATIDFGNDHRNVTINSGIVAISNIEIKRDNGTLIDVFGGELTLEDTFISAGGSLSPTSPIGVNNHAGTVTVRNSFFSPTYFWDGVAIRSNATTRIESTYLGSWATGVQVTSVGSAIVDNSTLWYNRTGVSAGSEATVNHSTIVGGEVGIESTGNTFDIAQFLTAIEGVQKVGDNFEFGQVGFSGNAWPANEGPENATDGSTDKYLNFGRNDTGLLLVPGGSSVISSFRIRTANDEIPRDPATYELWGTNTRPVAGQTSLPLSSFTLVSAGALDLSDDRDSWGGPSGHYTSFLNSTLYAAYVVVFPEIKGPNANSMQLAEFQMFQTTNLTVNASLIMEHTSASCSGRVLATATTIATSTCDGATIDAGAVADIQVVTRTGVCTTFSFCPEDPVPVLGAAAIDSDPSCSTGLTVDGRGLPRPAGAGCDAGAFEQQVSNDADTDGVVDADDRCMSTPAGLSVTSEGCAPSEFMCNGKPGTLLGTAASETLNGTSGADVIIGLEGIDTIDGVDGDDTICGGDGDDEIMGGAGLDTIFGNDGIDTISGGEGDDEISGGPGGDTLFGNDGIDTISGGEGDDEISGGPGGDTLFGNDGDDTMMGGDGDDEISGDAGGDTLFGNDGLDTISGGEGGDEISGGPGGDTIAGGDGIDTISGGDGGDEIDGGADGDVITGELGNDTISGGDGVDNLDGGDGADTLSGGDGGDTISGGSGDDRLLGDDGDDVITGGIGVDYIIGGTGADNMSGGDGNDRIRGQAGADTINGNAGNDFLYGGVDADTINGHDGNDTIGGFGGPDTIDAGPGNDKVFGGFGPDIINGGDGNDQIRGLIGNDTIHGDAGDDSLFGDNGQDQLFGDIGDDVLRGGNSVDTLAGGDGDDDLAGGKSEDSLSGGSGSDTCAGNLGTDTADATCETITGVP